MHGDAPWIEEFQSAYLEAAWNGIRSVKQVAGGVLWCWADYFHRRDFIQYAAFGPYGVVTVDRKPKKALATVRTLYGG